MLSFVTINIDGEYKEWNFNSIEELRKEYYREDYRICSNDDPVTEMEFHGIPMYVNTFEDIVTLFGLEQDKETDREVENLWDEFEDVPIDEDECLDVDWQGWSKGTHREEIWYWFDEHHSKGVGWLMYEYKR